MGARDEVFGLFETEFMRDVVRGLYDSLGPKTVAKIVAGSRATLSEKRGIYGSLAEGDPFFARYRDALDLALDGLSDDGAGRAVWLVRSCWVDRASESQGEVDTDTCACCASFAAARDAMRRETEDDADGDAVGLQAWYEVDKCELADGGQFRARMGYWCDLGGEPRYFATPGSDCSSGDPEGRKERDFWRFSFWPGRGSEPTHIALPLEPGDVVVLDCMPYLQAQQAIVTDNGNPWDCCLPQALAEGGDGTLHEGAIKHCHVGGSEGRISPLYRLRKADGDEPSEGSPLRRLAGQLGDAGRRESFRSIDDLAMRPRLGAEVWSLILERGWSAGGGPADPDPIGFIDSEPIRDHCRRVGWRPTATEAAYLVWQSRARSLADRHAAYRHIMRSMPDENIAGSQGRRGEFPSLRELLVNLMGAEREALHFALGDDCPGSWHWSFAGTYHDGDEKTGPACGSPSEAVSLLFEWRDSGDFERAGGELPVYYTLSKTRSGETDGTVVRLSGSLEPIGVAHIGACPLSEAQRRAWGESFGMMWVNLPLPFKAGDILCYGPAAVGNHPFVLSRGPLDPGNERDAWLIGRLLADGDESDMALPGYCIDPEGGFVRFHAYFEGVLQMTYFKGDLTGYDRKLPHLGALARGEIGVEECMRRCDATGAEVREELDGRLAADQREEIRFQFGK